MFCNADNIVCDHKGANAHCRKYTHWNTQRFSIFFLGHCTLVWYNIDIWCVFNLAQLIWCVFDFTGIATSVTPLLSSIVHKGKNYFVITDNAPSASQSPQTQNWWPTELLLKELTAQSVYTSAILAAPMVFPFFLHRWSPGFLCLFTVYI